MMRKGSQRKRKRIEEVFGWIKSSAGFRKTRHRGTPRVGWMFTLNAAAYNLVRLPKLPGTWSVKCIIALISRLSRGGSEDRWLHSFRLFWFRFLRDFC